MIQKLIKHGLYKLTGYILLVLTIIAFILILTGFALSFPQEQTHTGTIGLEEILTGITAFNSASVMSAGIGILFLIPIILLVTCLIYFLIVKDRFLFYVSILVLLFLSLSAFLALS